MILAEGEPFWAFDGQDCQVLNVYRLSQTQTHTHTQIFVLMEFTF